MTEINTVGLKSLVYFLAHAVDLYAADNILLIKVNVMPLCNSVKIF